MSDGRKWTGPDHNPAGLYTGQRPKAMKHDAKPVGNAPKGLQWLAGVGPNQLNRGNKPAGAGGHKGKGQGKELTPAGPAHADEQWAKEQAAKQKEFAGERKE